MGVGSVGGRWGGVVDACVGGRGLVGIFSEGGI